MKVRKKKKKIYQYGFFIVSALIALSAAFCLLFQLGWFDGFLPLGSRINRFLFSLNQPAANSYQLTAAENAADEENSKPFVCPPEKDCRKVPIISYHHISELPIVSALPHLYHRPALFEQQLQTLKKHSYNAIFMKDLTAAISNGQELPLNPLVITFDDGYEDIYQNAFPLLKKYQMKAVVYVIVDVLDLPGYLTKKQIKEMADSGLMEIGSHTLNHVNLRRASWLTAKREIFDSKTKLEKIIGAPVIDFAYPFGFFTRRDEKLVQQAGYLSAVSTLPGLCQSKTNLFYLYRLRPASRINDSLIRWISRMAER